MKLLEMIRKVLNDQIFWIVLFIVTFFTKAHVVIQVLIFFVMILGLKQFTNILLYWLYRLKEAREISLGGVMFKLPISSQTEVPPDIKVLESGDEAMSERLLLKAFQSYSAEQYQEALVLAESAAEKSPNNYKVYAFLGSICDAPPINNPAKGMEYNRRALVLRPGSFVPQFNLAVATNHVEGPSKSLAEYLRAEEYGKKEAVDADSEIMGKLNLFLADDYKNTGNYAEAKARYKKAEEILSKLAQRGDRTSQHWLEAAKKRYEELKSKGKQNE